MKFQPPRGTRDFLPEEMSRRRKIFGKIRKVFENYGYGEVCTPAFEDFELLAKKSGPDIEKEIYVFKDKSRRKLGLRFDPTVPICRIVSSNPSVQKPIKFYYITNMWRYDRPTKGRWREFWQAGIELIGSDKSEADAEIIAVVSDSLKAVGIKDFYFKINSRKIVDGILQFFKVKKSSWIGSLREIDKLKKIGFSAVTKKLESLGLDSLTQSTPLINMLENYKSIDELENYMSAVYEKRKQIFSGNEASQEFENLRNIIKSAKLLGVDNIRFDATVVRGIDYYTGFVFETFVKGYEDIGSIASGGRYDTLIGLYGGQDLPATGFGLGVDRLMEIIKFKEKYYPVKVFVVSASDDVRNNALRIVQKLRRKYNIKADTDLVNRSLSKQLQYVNSLKIPYVIIIGKEELGKDMVKLKNMNTGEEKSVKIEKIDEIVKSF